MEADASVATTHEPLDAECERTCPTLLEGPQQERIDCAADGIVQVHSILAHLLDEFADDLDPESHVKRALLSRAHKLAYASSILLSLPDDSKVVADAEREVRHG